jgi:hypothetical protein
MIVVEIVSISKIEPIYDRRGVSTSWLNSVWSSNCHNFWLSAGVRGRNGRLVTPQSKPILANISLTADIDEGTDVKALMTRLALYCNS